MASNTRLQIIIFTISLCNLSLMSSSSWRSLDTQTDYRKWVSWNVENYRKKTALQPQSINETPSGGGGKALDIKLSKAEMNKVTMTVSQDGTADYTTISDALHTIPLYNTRRVILVINPGVYRYAIIYIITDSPWSLYHFVFCYIVFMNLWNDLWGL